MKLLLIFNPHAAAGRAARLLDDILERLGDFADVELVQTRGVGDATDRVAEANLQPCDGLLAAGGDGTLFEVLNGLYAQSPDKRVPLGLVPVGTGNAFARDLGLMPGDWRKGIDLIRAGHLRAVDVGRVQGPAGGYHFLNIVGAGLPVDAMRASLKLKFLGNAAYTLATLWCAMKRQSFPLVVELDGDELRLDSLFIEVSNTRYTGTSFLIAPQAKLDDGLLDVTLVRRLSRLRLLRLFPTIYRGRHVEYEEVFIRKARSVVIRAPGGLTLAPDGEIKGSTPVRIDCLHRDLQIYAPASCNEGAESRNIDPDNP